MDIRIGPMLSAVLTSFVVSVTYGCAGISVAHDENGDHRRSNDELQSALRANSPISNLYDEGFRPVPGVKNTYYLPNSNIVVQCDSQFTLNASLKRTFRCFHVENNGHKVSGSDFDVQINPWQGGEGFSPYRAPHQNVR